MWDEILNIQLLQGLVGTKKLFLPKYVHVMCIFLKYIADGYIRFKWFINGTKGEVVFILYRDLNNSIAVGINPENIVPQKKTTRQLLRRTQSSLTLYFFRPI